MNPIIKNILAVISGVIIGGALNMAIVNISSVIIPPPEGANLKTLEGLEASMALMQPKHFIMPFLAHALGTFVGALLTAFLAANHKMKFAIGVGVWYLIGGIMMVTMVPSPLWFTIVDLVLAYLPIAYFAGKLVTKKK